MRLSYSSLITFSIKDYPATTIFEKDYQEWFNWAIVRTLQGIPKLEKYWFDFVSESDYYAVWDLVFEVAYDVVEDLRDRFPWGCRTVVIVEGGFGLGRRICEVRDFFEDFVEENRHTLTETVVDILINLVKENKGIRIKKEQLIKPNIYRHLERPIMSVFEHDLEHWIKDFPSDIVEKIRSGKRNWDAPEQIARDIIGYEIEEILKYLMVMERNSSYINIVFDKLYNSGNHNEERKKVSCQIMTIERFADKLYKLAYDNTLELLKNGRTKFQVSDIFDME
jgi:hypothetical protein